MRARHPRPRLLRILHVPSGKAYPVLRGEGPFYKAVAIAVPASQVCGLEVWRLTYRAR